jgi:ABC-type Na+ efflux pump permease subunit
VTVGTVGRQLKNIVAKEWKNSFATVSVILFLTLLPVLLAGQAAWIILASAGGGSDMTEEDLAGVPPVPAEELVVNREALDTLDPFERMNVFIFMQFPLYLLLIPCLVANGMSTFSIVEEKQTGTLEPLLAMPVKTSVLLWGKALAGAIPAVIATWVSTGLVFLVVHIFGPAYFSFFFLEPIWLIFFLLLTPLVALLCFALGVIASSRAQDAKNAQALSLVVILPLFGLITLQVLGVALFTPLWMLALSGGFGLAALLLMKAAVALFRRETILVRWT